MRNAEEGRSRWLGLSALSLGVAMIIVDATIVNVAVPSLVKDLGPDSSQAEWVNTTYALAFAAFLVTLGRAGDLIGRRITYLIGTALFAVASVVAGFAPVRHPRGYYRVAGGVRPAIRAAAVPAGRRRLFGVRDRLHLPRLRAGLLRLGRGRGRAHRALGAAS